MQRAASRIKPRSCSLLGSWLAGLSAFLLALALSVSLAPAAHGVVSVTTDRIAGPDRFATAAELAVATFGSPDVAIIASGEDYPDALVASYGPFGATAPILLSRREEVPQVTLDVLDQLGVRTVYLIGGERALHAGVERQLRHHGHEEVVRIGGADRYATAALMVDGPQPPEIGTLDGDRTALLASGEDFADALSAGPIAAGADLPLLLTPSSAPHPRTDEALEAQDIERIVIVGGQAAVSSAVVKHYQDLGYTVERWAGTTRAGTAATVADNAIERLGFAPGRVLLARGDSYPDALTASVHGGALETPLLLTATTDTVSQELRSWLQARCPDVASIRVIGGPAAVSDAALIAAVDAAETCHDAPQLPTRIEVSGDRITDQNGDVLLTIDELPDRVRPSPDTEFAGPSHFTDAVLSDDGAWIAIGSAGAAHDYGWLYDVASEDHFFVAFQYGGSVKPHSWSPDDRFALFTIRSPAEIDLLKLVDRDDIGAHPQDTGFVVEVAEEQGLEPPYAYEFTEWHDPHRLCFQFETAAYCVDAETAEPERVG